MKLSSEKLGPVLEQIDAEVIPDDHPTLSKLREVFGDHAFFIEDSELEVDALMWRTFVFAVHQNNLM